MLISSLVPQWDSQNDRKLSALEKLLKEQHPDEKVLIFTQFADTADYITNELKRRGIDKIEKATGENAKDVITLAKRFSPISNDFYIANSEQIRVLIPNSRLLKKTMNYLHSILKRKSKVFQLFHVIQKMELFLYLF